MRFRNVASLLAGALGLLTLTGCGGAATNVASAPPGGAFSNSNLSGTYIFSFSGYDIGYGEGSFFTSVGSLTANGNGNFTSGTIDIDDPSLGAAFQTGDVFSRLPVSGTYNITADGRGTGSISFTVNGTQVQFGLDFVLTSGSHGLITRFDNSGSGSGTIDLQTSNVPQSALQGSYAFGLNGVDSTTVNSLGTVGSFTLDGNGNVTSGLEDFGDNGDSFGLQDLAVQGTVNVGSPGSAQLTTPAYGFGTLHFDVWVIDATHLKLIETDSTALLEGDAFVSTGQTSFPSGQLVFTLSGEDTSDGTFAAGGLLTSDGSSQITGGLEDVNDEGYVEQAPTVDGSFTSDGPRTVLVLNGIYNGNFGNANLATGSYRFAAYPYAGGVMLLEIDNGAGITFGISGGTIYPQSATSISGSSGYGLNLSGANGNGEVDMIAEFATNGNSMTGLYDANNSGMLVSDQNLGTGTYSVSSNGRGTLSFPDIQTNDNSMIGALNLTFYIVNSSTVVFLETDGDQVSTGTFQAQNASAESASSAFGTAARSPFVVMRTMPSVHGALRLAR
ncbi:MAG TPA: hypothetical protein VME23_14245 [Terracidiphilus sp.]|nr:hypothetical protein [Terracidiphilus sp.]